MSLKYLFKINSAAHFRKFFEINSGSLSTTICSANFYLPLQFKTLVTRSDVIDISASLAIHSLEKISMIFNILNLFPE